MRLDSKPFITVPLTEKNGEFGFFGRHCNIVPMPGFVTAAQRIYPLAATGQRTVAEIARDAQLPPQRVLAFIDLLEKHGLCYEEPYVGLAIHRLTTRPCPLPHESCADTNTHSGKTVCAFAMQRIASTAVRYFVDLAISTMHISYVMLSTDGPPGLYTWKNQRLEHVGGVEPAALESAFGANIPAVSVIQIFGFNLTPAAALGATAYRQMLLATGGAMQCSIETAASLGIGASQCTHYADGALEKLVGLPAGPCGITATVLYG